MQRRTIALGAITPIALTPVAILSVDEASASRTASSSVTSIDEVVLVGGIGETTFDQVIAHARSLTARRSNSSSGKSNTSKG